MLASLGVPAWLESQTPAGAGYVESRRIDTGNGFPNVGALVTMAVKNDAGVPEGFLGKCSGILIHERVMLTAGHCVCPAVPAPPPFARLHVTFDPNARDETRWRVVEKVAAHPSLPACTPPDFSRAWPFPPVSGWSDVGLVFLAVPVTDIEPARLAPIGALTTAHAAGPEMAIVGYGHVKPVPPERDFLDWDGLRRVRQKRVTQVVDGTWATWALPGEACGGDSGGPILLDGAIVGLVSFVGRQCRDTSIHARVDVAPVQTWIRQTIDAHLGGRK
jgi:hypothetical protein